MLRHFGRGIGGVLEPVACLLDAFRVDTRLHVIQACLDEGRPVVRDDLVEIPLHLGKAVGFYAGNPGSAFFEKDLQEVTQAFPVLGRRRMVVSTSSQKSVPSG